MAPEPGDFVVASGKSSSIDELIGIACHLLGLDPESAVVHDKALFRPAEIGEIALNPSKAEEILGWKSWSELEIIVRALIKGDVSPVLAPYAEEAGAKA